MGSLGIDIRELLGGGGNVPPGLKEALLESIKGSMEPKGEVTVSRLRNMVAEMGDMQIEQATVAKRGLLTHCDRMIQDVADCDTEKEGRELLSTAVAMTEQNLDTAKKMLYDMLVKEQEEKTEFSGNSLIDRVIAEARGISGYDPTAIEPIEKKVTKKSTGFGFGSNQ